MLSITRLSATEATAALPELVALLQNVVDDGASIGFLPPLTADEARDYWQGIIADLEQGPRILLVGKIDGKIVGSVQLDPAMRKNGLHRAELQKLMVHTAARSRGIGRALVAAAEDAALEIGRTLIVLDTRIGDTGEALYQTHGYIEVGVIPNYVISEKGGFEGTKIFYKWLDKER